MSSSQPDFFSILDPRLQRCALILHPPSFESFEKLVYEDLDLAVKSFTSGLTTAKKDYLEDEISRSLCAFLKGRHYDASTGTYNNGETDITIKYELSGYKIICEAKKFELNKLTDGAYQLVTRYSRGDQNESGVMLIYLNNELGSQASMDLWVQYSLQQSEIDLENFRSLKFLACEISRDCKISYHIHPVSKSDYKIRHIPVNYWFNPQEETRPKQGRGGANRAKKGLLDKKSK